MLEVTVISIFLFAMLHGGKNLCGLKISKETQCLRSPPYFDRGLAVGDNFAGCAGPTLHGCDDMSLSATPPHLTHSLQSRLSLYMHAPLWLSF